MIKKITELRMAFWNTHEEFKTEYMKTYSQNQYRCDIRMAWCEFVDQMRRCDEITEAMAQRATL